MFIIVFCFRNTEYRSIDSVKESAGAGKPNTSAAQSTSVPTSSGTIDITV